MDSARKVPSLSPLVVISGDSTRFPLQPEVLGQNDGGSSRMGDEGCPNEGPSVDDATGYSREEEELNAGNCEEGL